MAPAASKKGKAPAASKVGKKVEKLTPAKATPEKPKAKPTKAKPTKAKPTKGPTLYEVLAVPRDANTAAIRKAYLQRSRVCHPDKNPGDDKAHGEFVNLRQAFDVLRNESRRKRYDATGLVEEEDFANAYAATRVARPEIQKADIDAFIAQYKGSDMELEDIQQAIRTHGVANLFECVIGSEKSQVKRYAAIISKLHSEDPGLFKSTPLQEVLATLSKAADGHAKSEAKERWDFNREEKKKKRKEAKEAEAMEGLADLAMQIHQKRKERAVEWGSFVDGLAEKYAPTTPKRRR